VKLKRSRKIGCQIFNRKKKIKNNKNKIFRTKLIRCCWKLINIQINKINLINKYNLIMMINFIIRRSFKNKMINKIMVNDINYNIFIPPED